MVEGGKDEFEKMNLSGFNSEKLAGRSVRADCGRYASIRFWGITSQDKKKNATKKNPYICRALRRQMKINFDNHVIKRPSM